MEVVRMLRGQHLMVVLFMDMVADKLWMVPGMVNSCNTKVFHTDCRGNTGDYLVFSRRSV